MKCTKCGTEFEGKFCSECGEPAIQDSNKLDNTYDNETVGAYDNIELHKKPIPRFLKIALIVCGLLVVGAVVSWFVGESIRNSNTAKTISSSDILSFSSELNKTSSETLVAGLQDEKVKSAQFHEISFDYNPAYQLTEDDTIRLTFEKGKSFVTIVSIDLVSLLGSDVLALTHESVLSGFEAVQLREDNEITVDGLPAISTTCVIDVNGSQVSYCLVTFSVSESSYCFGFATTIDNPPEKQYVKEFAALLDSITVLNPSSEAISSESASSKEPVNKSASSKSPASSKPPVSSAPPVSSKPPTSSKEPAKANTSGETTSQKNAVTKAKAYLATSAFSFQGLIKQLEYEKFSTTDATYGAEHSGANWKEQALKKAKAYLGTSAFSYQGLVEQLEYANFSNEEATYGADNCGADWNAQAVKKAKSYLELSAFSGDGLIAQLEYEGFTPEQAAHGARENGY